jgi:hypothetical protein
MLPPPISYDDLFPFSWPSLSLKQWDIFCVRNDRNAGNLFSICFGLSALLLSEVASILLNCQLMRKMPDALERSQGQITLDGREVNTLPHSIVDQTSFSHWAVFSAKWLIKNKKEERK